MNIGYPDTKNKKGSSGPLLNIDKEKVKKAKQTLKDAKQAKREYRKSKPYKKYEAGKLQYENRSEFKASMAEERAGVKMRRKELQDARKNYRKNKKNTGSVGPLLNKEDKKKVLPDPKLTKPKVARKLKRQGDITKEEFKTYKKKRKEAGGRKRPAITKGEGPNENFQVAVPRRKQNRKVRMEKRGSKRAEAYDKKLRESSPRVTEKKKIPKSKRTAEELKYNIDTRRVKVSDTKKEAKKRYRKYKNKTNEQ